MTVEWWVNDKKERTEHVFPPTILIRSQKQPDWRINNYMLSAMNSIEEKISVRMKPEKKARFYF